MDTSRGERRIGYLIGLLVALLMAGWVSWVAIGARDMSAATPSPTERGDVSW